MDGFYKHILQATGATAIVSETHIQTLWSGYGAIKRVNLQGGKYQSVVVKYIQTETSGKHPRGWNTSLGHNRKVNSYKVENHWYQHRATECSNACKIPSCLALIEQGSERLLILEDLDASGYPLRKSSLTVNQAKVVLTWLARFHARFMFEKPTGLWQTGTYWHLSTRPDEWNAMPVSRLKSSAEKIDVSLNHCVFSTYVHGDAKVANFCFSDDMQSVAAVDFQYVGGGCGMKDVAYFLGSCLSEVDCERAEEDVLAHYFNELAKGLKLYQKGVNANEVEAEYRALYPLAWADFMRFLLGWMPGHQKLNGYSRKMTDLALQTLDK